ncbi:MAG TPA: DUF1987 domain-containing protein [Williamwhitmania sp.]|nr:DUF1987 domain-containing protein [Williamwhitmania sp.]
MALNSYHQEATKLTPEISCNAELGVVELKGLFVSSDPQVLVDPVVQWINNYVAETGVSPLTLNLRLGYINGISQEHLNRVLLSLKAAHREGRQVMVNCYCEPDDEDMLDWADELASVFRLPLAIVTD